MVHLLLLFRLQAVLKPGAKSGPAPARPCQYQSPGTTPNRLPWLKIQRLQAQPRQTSAPKKRKNFIRGNSGKDCCYLRENRCSPSNNNCIGAPVVKKCFKFLNLFFGGDPAPPSFSQSPGNPIAQESCPHRSCRTEKCAWPEAVNSTQGCHDARGRYGQKNVGQKQADPHGPGGRLIF